MATSSAPGAFKLEFNDHDRSIIRRAADGLMCGRLDAWPDLAMLFKKAGLNLALDTRDAVFRTVADSLCRALEGDQTKGSLWQALAHLTGRGCVFRYCEKTQTVIITSSNDYADLRAGPPELARLRSAFPTVLFSMVYKDKDQES